MKKYKRALIVILAIAMMVFAISIRIVLSLFGATWPNFVKILIGFGWIVVFIASFFVLSLRKYVCPHCGSQLQLKDGSDLGEVREVTQRMEVSKYRAVRISFGSQQILERVWRCPTCHYEAILRIKEQRKASSKSIDF